METNWNVGDRVWVFVPFLKRRIRDTIDAIGLATSNEDVIRDKCKIKVDGFVEKYLICSSHEIGGRLLKKKIKDEPADIVDKLYHINMAAYTAAQRIAELESQLNMSKELGRKLANHNADLSEENAEMKKILDGEKIWLAHNGPHLVYQEVSYPQHDRGDLATGYHKHTKLLVLETKAAGEV